MRGSMHKIDSHMMRVYENSTSKCSANGKQISSDEAMKLIHCAREINQNTTGSSCFGSSDARGDKHLKRLLKRHKNEFSLEGLKLVKAYLETGKVPVLVASQPASLGAGIVVGSSQNQTRLQTTPAVVPVQPQTPQVSGHRPVGGVSVLPSVPSTTVVNGTAHTVTGAPSMPVRPNGGSAPVVIPPVVTSPVVNAPAVTTPSTPVANTTTPVIPSVPAPSRPVPSTPTPSVPPLGVPVATGPSHGGAAEGPRGAKILEWHANKAVERFHWFPLQETQPNGGDATNNLYSANGPLAKYGKFVGNDDARIYEFDHNRKAVNAGAEFGWWGHCDKAATAACILQAPKHDVIMTNANGEKVRFTKNDIQGMLVKVVGGLATQVDFRGERYNGGRDNPDDPLPDAFIKTMQDWSKDGLPFVLDIDPGPQVWNFPYDQVQIWESKNPPQGFNSSGLPNDGSVTYYQMELMGTGFPDKKRNLGAYIQRDASGKIVKQGWITGNGFNKHPDFAWRPHPVGDLRDKSLWVQHGKVSNPHVDPQIVYDIYMRSLA